VIEVDEVGLLVDAMTDQDPGGAGLGYVVFGIASNIHMCYVYQGGIQISGSILHPTRHFHCTGC
jgi:hypothetical protein